MKFFFLKVSYNQKLELNCAHFTEWAALQTGGKASVLSRFVRDQLLNLKKRDITRLRGKSSNPWLPWRSLSGAECF